MTNTFHELQNIVRQMRNTSNSLVEFSPFGYMWTVIDSPRLVASNTIYEMLEKEPYSEFFTVQSWKNHVYPKDLYKLVQAEEELMKTGKPIDAEYRLITETGRHLYVRHQMYLSGSSSRWKIMSVVTNITENKRAEVILEAMNEGCFELDQNFTFRIINDHAAKFWSLQPRTSVGKKIQHVFPQIEGTVFLQILLKAQAKKQDTVQDIQDPITGRWLHLSVAPYANGVIVTFYDITDIRKAQLEVLQLKDQLTAKAMDKYYWLFNSINQGFCIIEMIWDDHDQPVDYRFLETNPAFEKQTGIADAIGKTMREIEPAHESHWFEIYGEVAKTGKPIHFEQKAEPLMGGWYDVHAFPIEKSSNRVAILFDDITERKTTEEQRARAEKALLAAEQKYSMKLQHEVEEATEEIKIKSRQLESLNAELKVFNSLAANNYAETLRHVYISLETIVTTDARNLSNSSRANLRRAQAAIQKMKLLTNDINHYLELYDVAVRIETIDPGIILIEVKERLQKKIEDSNAIINVGTLPRITADPILFSKLMTHLIDNSIKHKKPDTDPVIQISHSLIAEESSSSNSREHSTYTIISITDNGIGFKEGEADKIFDLFTQLEEGKTKGSGIGLAVCKKIMEMHGGFLTAESEEGKGASFNCYFPVPA